MTNIEKKYKVYTPKNFAKFMIYKLNVDYSKKFKILEPAVGDGNIFTEVIKDYLKNEQDLDKIIRELNNNFFAFDNDENALKILKKRLNEILDINNIPKSKVKWKIEQINLLTIENVDIYKDITHVICNPPYLKASQLNKADKKNIKKFESCKTHNPNLYFAFIEFVIQNIEKLESFVVINPSSYLRSRSAKKLREIILSKLFINEIISFSDDIFNEQVLVSISVFNNKIKSEYSKFTYMNAELIVNSNISGLITPTIDNFTLPKENFENKIDNYVTFEDIFDIRGNIATLDDQFYVIKESEITSINQKFLTFEKNNEEFQVEKELLEELFVSPNRSLRKEYIIFPYDKNGILLDFSDISNKYPYYEHYFKNGKKVNKNEHSYGRNQNLKFITKPKLIIPKSMKKFTYFETKHNVVRSGITLSIKDEVDLNFNDAKLLLDENSSFIFKFLKNTLIQNDDKYYSISIIKLKKTPIKKRKDNNKNGN